MSRESMREREREGERERGREKQNTKLKPKDKRQKTKRETVHLKELQNQYLKDLLLFKILSSVFKNTFRLLKKSFCFKLTSVEI
jgi:hypothetical protein